MASPSRALRRALAVGLVAAGVALVPTVTASADPVVPADASQAEQQLASISRETSRLNEQVLVAQDDLAAKQAAEQAARDQVGAAQASFAQATTDQAQYQGTVDALAAASYQGARLNKLSALMLSDSPQELLDQMSALDVLATDTNTRVDAMAAATVAATTAQDQAAAAAQAATDAAAAAQQVADDLGAKQADLVTKAATVQAQFAALTPAQQTSYAGPTTPAGYTPPAAPTAGATGSSAATSSTAAASSGSSAPAVSGSGTGYAALQAAMSKLGSPYSYGANGPNEFDCSGLVQWSYGQVGVSLPRTTYGQAGVGSAVSQSDLQPGDIVIMFGGGHDGLYAGNGNVIHAPDYGQPVKIESLSYLEFAGARRL